VTARPDVEARHREQRRRTRRRILDAAHALLAEGAWSEVSLESVMARADLSRTAFYRHFPDRSALLLALLDDVGVQLEDIGLTWGADGRDLAADLPRALGEMVDTYARHGALLASVAEGATQDPALGTAFDELVDRIVELSAQRIAAEAAAGRSPVQDAGGVARALVLMNEAYLRGVLRHEGRVDPARATAVLAEVWLATVYR
jgi:AcrR family transcriptional regulator